MTVSMELLVLSATLESKLVPLTQPKRPSGASATGLLIPEADGLAGLFSFCPPLPPLLPLTNSNSEDSREALVVTAAMFKTCQSFGFSRLERNDTSAAISREKAPFKIFCVTITNQLLSYQIGSS
jgi:hypothetical protein